MADTLTRRARRLRARLRWRKCRHCGAPCYSFRLPADKYPNHVGPHWAHVYGEAHCEAPCSRWRRCRCTIIEED